MVEAIFENFEIFEIALEWLNFTRLEIQFFIMLGAISDSRYALSE